MVVGMKHPARDVLAGIIALNVFAWTLSLIAVFVPWSWKDTAVFERTTVGLWKNCVQFVNDPLDKYTCQTNDIDQVGSVSGGDEKCRGFIAATQVFTVASVCFTFLVILLAAYMISRLWAKPTVLAMYLILLAVLAFGCCLVAFLMWIVYAYTLCQAGNPLFPLHTLSWGWICMVVATFLTFLAMLLSYLALWRIMKFRVYLPGGPGMPVAPAPTVPMEPVFPVCYPTATPIASPQVAPYASVVVPY